MTSGHILFIPGVLLVGMFLGFIFGTRAAKNQFDLEQKRQADREAARAARAARREAAALSDEKPAAKPADKPAS